MTIVEKRENLLEQLRKETKVPVCLALSGGVDSALLAALIGSCAKENGTKAYGVTFDTVLHPAADLVAARQSAAESGLLHEVISVNELEFGEIRENPKNRCYLCKKGLFTKLLEFAADRGIDMVYEGTNYDDLSQYRPGLQAVKELGVKSPLLDHGFTKKEIRQWAKELGIQAASRPSAPCMATRLPYGTTLDFSVLHRLGKAEEELRSLGFEVVRARLHGEVVRLELPTERLEEAVQKREELIRVLKNLDFHYLTLDLEGFRSGSMDA